MRVDLNCDMGEGFGPWRMGEDAQMLELATSANIACGFHAGDPNIMLATIRRAKAHGVAIGAHPGFRDLEGFGRRPVHGISPTEVEALVAYQVGALQALASLAGARVTHVKTHGALYNLAADDYDLALAIASAVHAVDPALILFAMPGSAQAFAAEEIGVSFRNEVFADRAYDDNGRLVDRKLPGAVIHDAAEAAERALKMVTDGAVVTTTGLTIPVSIDTICIHGDTPGAVAMARLVKSKLIAAGVAVSNGLG